MGIYEVETDLLIHCRVKVVVSADNSDDALAEAASLLPNRWDKDASKKWKAKVEVTPPKNVTLTVVKAYHFEQTSGGEKARRVKT